MNTSLRAEQDHLGDYPHADGLTRGTIIQYDGWQWAVVTEMAVDHEPPRVGFVLLDDLSDEITAQLEDAWGCWEHYKIVRSFRDTEHEWWTDIEYLTTAEVWEVLGPIHPDERSGGGEGVAR